MQPVGFSTHLPDAALMRHGQGFTLIEMLISMSMGLLLIAGITSIFISDNNISRAISSRTERMGDLFLVSHLMQEALRESLIQPDPANSILTDLTNRGVSLPTGYPSDITFTDLPYWDASSQTLTYQNLDGNVGIFQYQRTSNDRIYWLRPASNITNFQELIRDLDPDNGMLVHNPLTNSAFTTNPWGGMKVILTSAYMNENRKHLTLSLSLMAWPRNK